MADLPFAPSLFPGCLASFADMLYWTPTPGANTDESETLKPRLARFQSSLGGGWRPACSLWSQYYFNRLLIPATCVVAGAPRECALARGLAPSFCPKSGLPLRFAILGAKEERAFAEPALADLLEPHIARVIENIADVSGLSGRMLWEGVETTVRWASAEIAACDGACGERLKRVADRRAPGSRLAAAWRAGVAPRGADDHRRRFCCLRYQLPGFTTCPGVCPRGQQVRQSRSVARPRDDS